MEEYNLLYIDDDIDSQLSEYLDKDLKNALQSDIVLNISCLLYTSPSPRDYRSSRMPSSA